jgi:pimeloyl-ACP methyl ester carboxylesterase
MYLLNGSDGEHGVLHDFGGDGPPVLLTHGNGLNAGMWTTALPVLQGHRRCFGLDFRGHGASRVITPPLDVDRSHLVAEVLHAATTIDQGPIDAVGHSLGGATLLRAELEKPGTFRTLWVFEPVMIPEGYERPDEDHPLVLAAKRRRNEFPSLESFVERLRSKPPYSECEDDAVWGYATLGTQETPTGVSLTCSGDTEARIYGTGTVTDFPGLNSIKTPTAVARGELVGTGNELPAAMAEPIASHLGEGKLLKMDGLTHFGPMEDGSRVGEAILAHLLA